MSPSAPVQSEKVWTTNVLDRLFFQHVTIYHQLVQLGHSDTDTLAIYISGALDTDITPPDVIQRMTANPSAEFNLRSEIVILYEKLTKINALRVRLNHIASERRYISHPTEKAIFEAMGIALEHKIEEIQRVFDRLEERVKAAVGKAKFEKMAAAILPIFRESLAATVDLELSLQSMPSTPSPRTARRPTMRFDPNIVTAPVNQPPVPLSNSALAQTVSATNVAITVPYTGTTTLAPSAPVAAQPGTTPTVPAPLFPPVRLSASAGTRPTPATAAGGSRPARLTPMTQYSTSAITTAPATHPVPQGMAPVYRPPVTSVPVQSAPQSATAPQQGVTAQRNVVSSVPSQIFTNAPSQLTLATPTLQPATSNITYNPNLTFTPEQTFVSLLRPSPRPRILGWHPALPSQKYQNLTATSSVPPNGLRIMLRWHVQWVGR